MQQKTNRGRYLAQRLIINGLSDKLNQLEQVLPTPPSEAAEVKLKGRMGGMSLKKSSSRSNAPSIFAHDTKSWARTSLASPKITIGSQEELYEAFLESQNSRHRMTRVYNFEALDPTAATTVEQFLNQTPEPGVSGFNISPDHIMRHSSGGNNEPGDSPFDLPARTAKTVNGSAPEKLFEQQDCWKTIGADGRAKFDVHGEGITVVVLDAAPEVARINPAIVNYYVGMKGAQLDYPDDETPPRSLKEIVGMGRVQPPAINRSGDKDVDPAVLKPYHGLLGSSMIRELAPKAKIVLVEVLNDEGETTGSVLTEAIDYVLYLREQQVTINGDRLIGDKVIFNMSLGIERSLTEEVEAPYLLDVCERVCDAGGLIVAAAGNDSYYLHPRNPEEPAAYGYFAESHNTYNQVIAVSATGYQPGEYALYSNRGNFAAPGMDILMDTGDDQNPCSSRYIYWVGTSFAAPIVTGVAALVLSAGAAVANVKKYLWEGTERPINWNFAPEVNAQRSLEAFYKGSGPTKTV